MTYQQMQESAKPGQIFTVSLFNQAMDSGLRQLGPLASLKTLNLDGTQVTDAGLAELASLPQLEELWLQGTAITRAGFPHLKQMNKLKEVLFCAYEVDINEDDVDELQRALPALRIRYGTQFDQRTIDGVEYMFANPTSDTPVGVVASPSVDGRLPTTVPKEDQNEPTRAKFSPPVEQRAEESVVEQIRALQEEFIEKQQELSRANRGDGDIEAQRELDGKYQELRNEVVARFAEIVEKHGSDEAVFPALRWMIGSSQHAAKAIDVLVKHHLNNEDLGAICFQLATQGAPGAEKLARAVARESRSEDAKTLALFLARSLDDALRRIGSAPVAARSDVGWRTARSAAPGHQHTQATQHDFACRPWSGVRRASLSDQQRTRV